MHALESTRNDDNDSRPAAKETQHNSGAAHDVNNENAPNTIVQDEEGSPFRIAIVVSSLGACALVMMGTFFKFLPGSESMAEQWWALLACGLAANVLVMCLARMFCSSLTASMMAAPWIAILPMAPPFVIIVVLVGSVCGLTPQLVCGLVAAIVAYCHGIRVFASGVIYMASFFSVYFGLLAFTGHPLSAEEANDYLERGSAVYESATSTLQPIAIPRP